MPEPSFSHIDTYPESGPESGPKQDRDPYVHHRDRSQEFYDPFSELNLFLSRKIKKAMQEDQSFSKWSGKIETALVAKILPEFRRLFPTYRLRSSTLKRVWERVSYYYKKVHRQKNALCNNGELNLQFMIRENLKHSTFSISLPPYLLAKQIAEKISECVATIEGKCLELQPLTKMIWAVQRHLLKDLSSINAKIPYEEYDVTDKLIVKLLLEITAKGENLACDLLKEEIVKSFRLYEKTAIFSQQGRLFSTVAMVFAKNFYHTSHISCHFSLKDREHIETFIRYQIELSRNNSTLMKDEHRIELIQRILALYSVTHELPKHLNEVMIRRGIREMRYAKENHFSSLNKIDQALFVFFNAEMHLMSESKSFEDHSRAEDSLVKAYRMAMQLPVVTFKQMDQFELLIWKIIEEERSLLQQIDPQIYHIIEKEIGNVLIDNPFQSLRMVVSITVQFFKKVQTIDLSSQTVKEKIDMWVVQNDMLIRWVHFDSNTPLLILLKNLWNRSQVDENSVNHKEFIECAFAHALKRYPLLHPFTKPLLDRLWILYKYLWYTIFTDGNQSTYERFLMWHHTYHKHCYPIYAKDKLQEILCTLSNQLIPLVPFKNMGET